jgi:hypothetical protein
MFANRQRWYLVCGLLLASLCALVIRRGLDVTAASRPEAGKSDLSGATTTVLFNPGSLSMQVGQVTNVSVRVQDVANLEGFYLHITFDAAVIQVRDADPAKDGVNVALGGFLSPDAVPVNECTIVTSTRGITGTIRVAVSQVLKAPRSGSGNLINLSFAAIKGGPVRFTFQEVGLSDQHGLMPNIVLVAPSYVVVEPSPTPTATFTPQPTATPSLTPSITPTPSPTPYFYLVPQLLTTSAGQEAEVVIRTSLVHNLSRVMVYLYWNPALLQVFDADPLTEGVQVTPGDLFAGRTIYRPPQGNLVNNTAGTLFYALSLGTEPGMTGAWAVATIRFRALAGGFGTLGFSAGTRMATWQSDVPSGWINGEVWVQGDTPTPSVTPSTTLTPSVTPTPSTTMTPSLTLTPSITPTSSRTPTPSQTLTPSLTSSPSVTLTPTRTATLTNVPTVPPAATGTATPAAIPRLYCPLILKGWLGGAG